MYNDGFFGFSRYYLSCDLCFFCIQFTSVSLMCVMLIILGRILRAVICVFNLSHFIYAILVFGVIRVF